MSSLPLVFDAPRRGTPPRHLADLDPADRAATAAELGLPKFRLDQLARHYFGRLTTDLEAMTDLGADAREKLAALLPPAALQRLATHIASYEFDAAREVLDAADREGP